MKETEAPKELVLCPVCRQYVVQYGRIPGMGNIELNCPGCCETFPLDYAIAQDFKRYPKRAADTVNHPSHYNDGKIEVIEFIEDKKLGFHLGNAVKYIARAGKKDPAKIVEDLKKAAWYIQREIELHSDKPRRPNEMNP